MAKFIAPCDDSRGHFWRAVNESVSQCDRCAECATREMCELDEDCGFNWHAWEEERYS